MRAGAVCTLLRHVTERPARAGKYFALSPPVTAANRAATYWLARMMKVSDKGGTVTPGKYADIIASTR